MIDTYVCSSTRRHAKTSLIKRMEKVIENCHLWLSTSFHAFAEELGENVLSKWSRCSPCSGVTHQNVMRSHSDVFK